jgi:hypothetical protein
MEIILILTSLITFAIFLTISTTLIKNRKNNLPNKKISTLIILAITYLIFSTTLFLWSFNFLNFNPKDLLIILSIILIIQTISLLTILYEINQNKKIFYCLIPLLLLIPLLILSPKSLHITIPISLLILLYAFLSTTSIYKKSTRNLTLYASTSILLYIFSTIWENLIPILVIISSALFLKFIIQFLELLNSKTQKKFYLSKAPESPIIHFLKHFIFIVIITNFIFIGTVSIHEFGHLAASTQSNCEEAKIIYELKGLPHTEIICSDQKDKNLWILSGIILPFIIASFLFFGGGKFMKEMSIQIAGFNLIISYLDIKSLNIPQALATFALIAGIATVIFSLALFAKSRIE